MSHQQDGECLGQGEEDQWHGWLGNSHDLNLIENLRVPWLAAVPNLYLEPELSKFSGLKPALVLLLSSFRVSRTSETALSIQLADMAVGKPAMRYPW
jgi:hypothetical protein